MISNSQNIELNKKARALAAFADYGEYEAFIVVRFVPDVLEVAIKRCARDGIAACEEYLREVA